MLLKLPQKRQQENTAVTNTTTEWMYKIRDAYHLFGWNVKWNGSTRWKFSGIEGMPSKVFLFFRFNRNDRDKLYHLQKSYLCHSLTHCRWLCEPWHLSRPSLPSSTGSFLTNGTTASYFDPFLPEEINCSICPKNLTRKFHANGKRSRCKYVPQLFASIVYCGTLLSQLVLS